MKKSTVQILAILASVALLASCSINRLAVNVLADTLAGEDGGGASVFASDPDPELVGEALPFALKLYELVLEESPEHEGLLLATGSGFVSYANAFVATPASMLTFEEFEQKQRMQTRAKALYLRGREYLIRGLEVRHPGFTAALAAQENDELDVLLEQTNEDDVAYLYWTGAAWVAAFALDAFDLELAFSVRKAERLMIRALELDPDFNDGAIHSFLLQYYAALPASLGGDREKALFHYERALEVADGRLAGPYVSYGESIAIPDQELDLFVELMEQALEVDVDAYPPARLVNVITQEKATWYLENLEDFFLLDLPFEEEEAEE
ncbi:MAG: TRAP transporter TatT component family protein [Spirochaetales bacterium]